LRKSSWCRDANSSRRHEGTTVKRCHFNLPDFLELGSDRAKCKARRAGTRNATTLAEYRKARCNYLNDKEAGQGPRFASISSERHGCIPVSFHKPTARPISDSTSVRSANQEWEALPVASDEKGMLSICTAAQEVAVPLLANEMGNIVTASEPRPRLRNSANSAHC